MYSPCTHAWTPCRWALYSWLQPAHEHACQLQLCVCAAFTIFLHTMTCTSSWLVQFPHCCLLKSIADCTSFGHNHQMNNTWYALVLTLFVQQPPVLSRHTDQRECSSSSSFIQSPSMSTCDHPSLCAPLAFGFCGYFQVPPAWRDKPPAAAHSAHSLHMESRQQQRA